LVGSAGEVVAGVVDVLGHLLVVAPRGHRTADGIAATVCPGGGWPLAAVAVQEAAIETLPPLV
jgi:hypothetical protein